MDEQNAPYPAQGQNTPNYMNEQNAPYPMQGQNNIPPPKKGKAGLGLALVLIGLLIFTPLGFILATLGFPLDRSILIVLGFTLERIGFVLIIWGLVLGFKARKISNGGLPLATITIGIIALILSILTLPLTLNALVFSSIDFGELSHSSVDSGGLLPNSINFDKSFRADASQMNIVSDANGGKISLVLDYVGTSGRINIDSKNVIFDSELGNSCGGQTNTDVRSGVRTFGQDSFTYSDNGAITNIQLSIGDGLVIEINCPTSGSPLVSGDNVEGTVTIQYTDIRTGVVSIATGTLRGAVTN